MPRMPGSWKAFLGLTRGQGDIQNQELVAHLMGSQHVRKVFHFAAESHVDNSIKGPAPFIATNLVGTFSLLEAARQVWAGDQDVRFFCIDR